MQKAIIIVGGVTAVIVLGGIVFLAYMGMFKSLEVTEKTMGPFTHVYESFQGPYPETGKIFDKVYNVLKAQGIDATQGLGVYYDDPRKTAKDKLQSDCGVVLQEKDLEKAESLKEQFKIKVLEQKNSIIVSFPVKSRFSYMLGPMKAYPALTSYAEKKGYQITLTYEMYDEPNGQILFVANIE
ncbi:hypothetical protein KAR10_00860 [bacterium]|nr:hypothetical protein [bacterium]